MRRLFRPGSSTRLLAAGVLLAALSAPVHAQLVAPDYALTAPSWRLPTSNWSDADAMPRQTVAPLGAVRVGAAGSSYGSGLSVEAGEKWFARAGLGRSLDMGTMTVGGGYRFAGGDALSMQVMRLVNQDRLGLALRYDWQRSYLRLSYEQPMRTTPGSADLRFQAGMRF